jgi:S1-C subfamily serine protease
VTAVNKSITATEADGGNAENLTGLIEVNADIQAGDSGGPLVDTAGKVLGMDTAASTGFSFQTTGTQGYAIPINTALEVARKIEASNGSDTVHIGATGFLGVEVSDEPSNTAQTGALVVGVVPGSPAAAAGLVDGDSITALDGNTVGSAEALTTMMGTHHPGNHVQLTWTDASGAVQRATLKLSAGPAA